MKTYFVWFNDADSVIVDVREDVNRPNNDDCDTVLLHWIHENYGNETYEYFDLDTVPVELI